ncbi:sugar kinase [Neobacillus cucumis]|uniref:2-dehydro-3-deoxygluconokinase n=1 Tax=Neobacillus cucumis TaxID=1740721 RepID=A0A2N5H9N1_9BACI|nr:sugar kinase [Neobacillus cucumis]PLS02237.1 2-dehydro-3-deoxygluconokinase [Neobacillus cucumis]
MKKIVTLGEIMLRLSVNNSEKLFQADQLTMHYGGAEANVAVSLSNFGHDVYFVSKIPENPLGIAVERQMKANSVHTDYLMKGGERLGTYYLEIGVGQRSSQVTYDRKYSSFSMLRTEEINLDEVFSGVELFHVSGITPALSQNLKELTLLALKKAKEKGILTSFDFNYRAKLWSQQEAAETIKELLPFVDICSCGELDAVYILGMDQADHSLPREEKLRYYYSKLIEMYPNIRYIGSTFRNIISASTNTLQGNYFTEGELYQSKVFQIDHIVDRVGGGDAFAAGILYGILENMPSEELIAFATAASALKHTVHGDYNVFSVDEVVTFANNGAGKIVR